MSDTISRKGVFIPDITVEMFRNASLESIEDLMASGEMEDILLPSAQPEIISCKDCGHFHYDMPCVVQGVPVLGHEVCDFWGFGCKTSENGYCSFAERREDERPES